MHLEVDRSDIRTARLVPSHPHDPPATGHVTLAIEKFALTSNNVSYALSGDLLDYWGFFPAAPGWGRLPAMGFGRVTVSDVPGIEPGARYFGFYPVADHHTLAASANGGGFVDVGAHRERHAMAYRQFEPASQALSDEDESYYLLLRGLFVTSFLADDFLADNADFGARRVVVTSASSKTALAFAHEYRSHGRGTCVGMTSTHNVDFTVSTGLYDTVITYDDIESMDASIPTVVVDMAGNAHVLRRLHLHLDGALRHSCRIGATHWDSTGSIGDAPGPEPQFFFAPSQLAKRGKEWGRQVLEERMGTALSVFMTDARRWLTLNEHTGPDAVLAAWEALVSGQVHPADGHVLSM